MPRWEYMFLDGKNRKDDGGRGPSDLISEDMLNEYGAAGWEVVTGSWDVSYGSGHLTCVLLKRRSIPWGDGAQVR